MTKRWAGFGIFCCFLGLVAACGGSALGDGNATGGAAGSSGAASLGGSSSAGSAMAGASSTAGVGGVVGGDRCSLPEVSGPCEAAISAFWHNPKSGLCEPFYYGGCGGNDNRFESREACLASCPGGGADWGACQRDSGCVLSDTSCCTSCEPVEARQFIAVSATHRADLLATRCAEVQPCAPCQGVSEAVATGKYFKAVCLSGQCSVLDIRQSPITECATGSDCMLRDGTGCCTECDGGFVSVNRQTNFCPDGPAACPKCASIPPGYLIPDCEQGRCLMSVLLR